jgi:integrase
MTAAFLSPETPVTTASAIWLRHVLTEDYSAATIKQYRGSVDRYIVRSSIAELSLTEVNRVPVIEQWLRDVSINKGRGAATGARKALRGTIGLAVRHGVLPSNAFADVRLPRNHRKTQPRRRSDGSEREHRQTDRSFTDAERLHLLSVLDDHPVAKRLDLADLMAYMLGTGVRISEALGQRWEDVDLDRGAVHVRGTKTRFSDRVIYLPDWLSNRLTRRFNRLRREGFQHGTPPVGVDVVFHSPATDDRVRPRNRDNAIKGIRQILDDAGLEWATSHSFRHTAITRILEAGFDIGIAADHAGHADIRTTQGYIGRKRDTSLAARAL